MKKETKTETIRHSWAHLLAAAVQEIFPGAKFGIGPTIEDGFYYDFDLSFTLKPEDLSKIEKQMKEMAKKNLPFEKKELSITKAKELFKKLKQPYKVELVNDLVKNEKAKKVTIYTSGSFADLCRGPHIKSTKELKGNAFKLTKLAGAYWKGSENNKMLQRVYGIAFLNKKELDQYLKQIAEAEKRDHRLLGQRLNLFHIDENFGAGLILWHPKGALLRHIIESYWIKEHLNNGYHLIQTPHIAKLDLWQKSGHWDFYRESMYSPMKIEEEEYVIKPMNCPGHILIYKNQIKSYRDLPLRWAELGTVYRYEKSGVLHGLTRVRGFTQDDAHIFTTLENLDKEINNTLQFGLKILKSFGFNDFEIYLSTRPKKYVGNPKNWQKATKALKSALNKNKLKYQTDEGEGVFYGPKIDIKIKDSLGRAWQCTTIQVDFNLPERFDISYINQEGKKEQPIMIHRALLGSLERFIGVMIEHYAGALPVWLSPSQVWIVPIGQAHKKYSQQVAEKLKENNIRFEIKEESETVSKKIREGELQKIPYLLVVGDKEKKAKSVRAREREKGDIGEIKTDRFIERIRQEIESKK